METDDLSLGLSPVESALPPSRGVCALWLGSLFLLFLFSYCSSYRPPLQSISHPAQNTLSVLRLHTVYLSGHQSAPRPILCLCTERDNNDQWTLTLSGDQSWCRVYSHLQSSVFHKFLNCSYLHIYKMQLCGRKSAQGCQLFNVVGGEIVKVLQMITVRMILDRITLNISAGLWMKIMRIERWGHFLCSSVI